MAPVDTARLLALRAAVTRVRGDSAQPPELSIVIPVNAQGDLDAALATVATIADYKGSHRTEIVLVVNNYPPEQPPAELAQLEACGINVVAAPSARRPGEVIILSARALGVRAANARLTIHFDADCKFPDVDALLNWYVAAFGSGARLAYSHVDFHDYQPSLVVKVKIALHHAARWVKRTLLGIPTTRGSNYAVDRELFLQLYDAGKLSVDMQVGPAAKLAGARVAYSGKRQHRVLTSGRKMRASWGMLVRMLRYRLKYNLKAIPTRRREVTRTSWGGFDRESEARLGKTAAGTPITPPGLDTSSEAKGQ